MCRYKILHHNEDGYAVKCNECGHIKVCYKTVVLTLDEEMFYAFRDAVEHNYESHRDRICPHQRRIHISTADPSVSMVFCLTDLERLIQMLDEAHMSLEIEKLIS
ncbi:MAG: DUF6686 family protein [Flavobacteriales bacterium]